MNWVNYAEKDVNDIIDEILLSPTARKLKLERREYQVIAALKCYENMAKGKNVVINLPTGTGKTMVANILSLMMLYNNPEQFCLYLAPLRTLAYQHRCYSNWLAPKYQSLLLTDNRLSIDQIYTLSLRSKIIISTPERCANLIRSHALPPKVLQSICMLSIDEFDDHFIFEYSDNGPQARLDFHFSKFYDCVPKTIPVQLVSATDPKTLVNSGNDNIEIIKYNDLMDELYKPIIINVSPNLYADYIPAASIQIAVVNDLKIFFLAKAISVEIRLIFDRIHEETNLSLNQTDVLLKLEAILKKTVSKIELINGSNISVSEINMNYFYGIRNWLNFHEHLYEDMLYGIDCEIKRTKILDHESNEYLFIDLPRIIDNRNNNEFNVNLDAKFNVLLNILSDNQGKVGVIFTRKIKLSNELYKMISQHGWTVVQIDSSFPDKDQRLFDFQNNKYNLLIITRKTGERGLDLPQADFAIFYSPKARETTTWQELSRIRSNIHKIKTSYFLCYGDTPDDRRMDSLIYNMRKSGREYQISEPLFYGERPDNSDFSIIESIDKNI